MKFSRNTPDGRVNKEYQSTIARPDDRARTGRCPEPGQQAIAVECPGSPKVKTGESGSAVEAERVDAGECPHGSAQVPLVLTDVPSPVSFESL